MKSTLNEINLILGAVSKKSIRPISALVRVSTPRNTKVCLWVETRIRLDLEQIYFF